MRFRIQGEIGVLHGALALSGVGRAEEGGQAEIFALDSPFVVERSFICSDDAAAAFHEGF